MRAYRDVFTACPANPPVPAQTSESTHEQRWTLTLILQLPSALESPPQAKEKPQKKRHALLRGVETGVRPT
jgi:hypothetical protein